MGEEIDIKKKEEFVWEIPKSGKMRVPAFVYASEALIKKIKEDKTLLQAQNVACLKGIQKASYVMPDAHQGYGFPIGGVAAFDMDEGIISPGGVGYDINCLTGDSKILDEFGCYKQISEFEEFCLDEEVIVDNVVMKKLNARLKTLNLKTKQIEIKPASAFMKKKIDDVFEVRLESGLTIKATKDHPFLTKEGMAAVESLFGQEVGVNLFEGVPRQSVSEKSLILAKIVGYLFGDGCMYFSDKKGYAVFYGKKEDLLQIQEDISQLGFRSQIHSRTREHNILTQYGNKEFASTTFELHVKTREFVDILKELGVPAGNKTRQDYSVPDWIKKGHKCIKRMFLAAFFGAELSAPATHTKTGFYSPVLSQNKISSLSSGAKSFMLEISRMLEDFGVVVNKISERDEFINQYGEKTKRFRLILSAEESNLVRLWRSVGFEYNTWRSRLANIAVLYILLKKQENITRQELAEKIKQYRKIGFGISEVKKAFSGVINERFIERHYYENAGQRLSLDFISFKDFKDQKLEEYADFGAIFDKVQAITHCGKEEVYDFNVRDNHNFFANSFIVSNCGVRLLRTDWTAEDVDKKRQELLDMLFKEIPAGVGRGGLLKLSRDEFDEVLNTGSSWALKNGYGVKDDLDRTEENGFMKSADPSHCSTKAISRGLSQLGTLGAGNHFLELQKVDKIYEPEIAKAFGIDKEGQVTVMIHCGSRGFGHQVASDYIKLMENKYGCEGLPDRELINAPIHSDLGQKYVAAMACAINFAFANRQMITHWTRDVFAKVMGDCSGMNMVYDVCHNIAKFEKHAVDGESKDVCVHRKGATRSFGPDRSEVPEVYRKIGQPVMIPGSMGTASYLLVGTRKAEEISWGSTAHGAGRVASRSYALKHYRGQEVQRHLEELDIKVKAGSKKGLAEECHKVYKDIDEVIRVSTALGIGNKVARLVPIGVVKG
ncbi:RNA-splicing ligase RtcB [Candidatus Woesearchaeota archaeon]|nr:RNA-splicing ligase RtcB [Candidatus Woesearchaeota archaeon]